MSSTQAPALPVLIAVPEQLDGPRVRVRPYHPDDAQALWEAVDESRDHLLPWLPWVNHYASVDDARITIARMQAHWLLREDLPLGVFDLTNGSLLGGSGLHRINWQIRTFEIGYWLRRSAEGHGYMAEAVQLLTSMAFRTLAANRVEIRMDARNARSEQIPKRLGFIHEGTLRNNIPDADGQPRNTHVYALIPDDYRRVPWASHS
jgi:RimJ/RimL family protein N-acetyltransferase